MSAATLIIVLLAAPLVSVLWSLLVRRAMQWVNLLAALVCFPVSILLLIDAAAPRIYFEQMLYVDRIGAWVLMCVALVYLLASFFAIDYMRHGEDARRLPNFYALFALFAWTMFAAPMANMIGVYWIGIEMTTLVSTFLVGYERRAESMEAAWKYIIIVSGGISIALLGTVLLYWGGTFVLGPTYTLDWSTLDAIAPKMPAVLLQLGFLLALVGYGVKAGLAPMHTWLPDAHSECPAPVSAMLSGALLNCAMLGIVRFLAATDIAGHGGWPHRILIALGVASLVVGALFIMRQRGLKRMLAYSSVEHMGVIALGFGFGGVLGVFGALYHMLNHSINKTLMFIGAGSAVHRYGTHDMQQMRNLPVAMPGLAWLWLAGAVAITGAPPFGLFRSELSVLMAGWMHGGTRWVAVLFLLLLIVIFIGFLNHFRQMYVPSEAPAPDGPLPGVMTWIPMLLAVAALLLLGLWWPPLFTLWFGQIAHQLGAVS
jgi:hydrogenase-4 component F